MLNISTEERKNYGASDVWLERSKVSGNLEKHNEFIKNHFKHTTLFLM